MTSTKSNKAGKGQQATCEKDGRPNWVIEQLKEEEYLRNKVSVSYSDYTEAIQFLVAMAQQDISGSLAAAQVILSLYNGYNWHVDLTDLCHLDYEALQYVLIAIRGRLTLHEEPHNVIENGAKIFAQLENKWQHLHIANRYK